MHGSVPITIQLTFIYLIFDTAGGLYLKARLQGWINNTWATITPNSNHHIDMSTDVNKERVANRRYAGNQTVFIRQIRGSENRYTDFDNAFHPIKSHNKDRWIGIANAHRSGIPLPAVDLILIDDTYFIRDGHHRISVSSACDEDFINAKVTAWEIV